MINVKKFTILVTLNKRIVNYLFISSGIMYGFLRFVAMCLNPYHKNSLYLEIVINEIV